MNSALRLGPAMAALVIALAVAAPVRAAAEADLERFKTEIDAFVGRLEASTNGVVKWLSSDPYEVRRDGNVTVAVITNARLSLQTQPPAQLALDRVEIRQIGQQEDGKLIKLAIGLPKLMTLSDTDGSATTITLNDATATALVEAQSGRGRETAIAIASARIDQADTGAWVSTGPLSMTSKLIAEPNGGWSGPVDFEITKIGYFFPKGPVGGGIDRIAFSGRSAGPKLEELDKLRGAVDRLQSDGSRSPEARGAAFLAALPGITTPFGNISGEFGLDGLTARSLSGEDLVLLAKADSRFELTGLDGEMAAIRFRIRHEGLELAPLILDATKVPHRVVLDVAVGDISTQALGKLLRAVSAMADENATADNRGQPAEQRAIQQVLGALAMLTPILRVHDIALDTRDVGVELTGEAKGSPLAPNGYTAAGDLVVRGFDAIPRLAIRLPFAEYLPVLKELGVEHQATGETSGLVFHLASAPPRWLTINGNDVSSWFAGIEPRPGQARLLKPADPPMEGNDVRGVQRALAAARIAIDQDGVYRAATAAAVARFQSRNGMNVTGVVDGATRQRLGIPAEMPRQGGRN